MRFLKDTQTQYLEKDEILKDPKIQ